MCVLGPCSLSHALTTMSELSKLDGRYLTGEAPFPRVASHEPDTDKSESLGPFSFTMISDGSGPTLTSTVEATVTESLNGTEVLCRDGGSSNSTIVGRVTVRVVGECLCVCTRVCVRTKVCACEYALMFYRRVELSSTCA